jgi:glycosyltransferase involved in cell wall biosynthesis
VISFIVPAYNEERLLARTLAAIHTAARAIGQPHEVIVVDDGSTDATAGIARANGARVVTVAVRQISRTRNAGARASAGGILIFVDADTIVSAAVVQASLDALARGAVGGGAGVEFEGGLPLWGSILASAIAGLMRMMRLAAGCYVFCTRAAFDVSGGFPEDTFAGEELFFSRALGKQGRFVILRESVSTSARKIRTHDWQEMVRLVGAFTRRGTGMLRNRESLGLWYDGRRDDPGPKP